jgi:hypothetical protein
MGISDSVCVEGGWEAGSAVSSGDEVYREDETRVRTSWVKCAAEVSRMAKREITELT